MSERTETITLRPPERIHRERIVSAGYKCRYCNGRGYFPPADDHEEPAVCPDCEGSGEVVAMVTVDWKPRIR